MKVRVRAKKPYYECHITLTANPPGGVGYAKHVIEHSGWKFSKIDGDPIMGEGIRVYATRHFNARRTVERVEADLVKTADILSRAGLKVTRRKIEMVVLDHLIGE